MSGVPRQNERSEYLNAFLLLFKFRFFIHKTSEILWRLLNILMPAQYALFWKHERLAVGLRRWSLFLALTP